MEKVYITTEFIKLEQLLKLAGVASTGGEAKIIIQNGETEVNSTVCFERGKKLRQGDIVKHQDKSFEVIKKWF